MGSVTLEENRCVAFPCLYQRRYEPFELLDKGSPGFCKFLVLFLVDPLFWEPLISTSEVPQQRRDWQREALRVVPKTSLLSQIPLEIRDMIADIAGDEEGGKLSTKEAMEYRTEFLKEKAEFLERYEVEHFQRSRDEVYGSWESH